MKNRPHRGPKAAPNESGASLTEADLAAIERMVAQDCLPNRPERTVLALVTEVRRLQAALAGEREACAKIADDARADEEYGHAAFRCVQIAQAIRARGEPVVYNDAD